MCQVVYFYSSLKFIVIVIELTSYYLIFVKVFTKAARVKRGDLT